MSLGEKEKWKYKDITGYMPSIDVPSVLKRLGLPVVNRSGSQIFSFCPDHEQYTGRKPSHPKWNVNIQTGETMCFTEGRGSNLLFIVSRLLKCSGRDALKFLTGTDDDIDLGGIELKALSHKLSSLKIQDEEDLQQPKVAGLDNIKSDMEGHYMSDVAYEFFMNPPEKKYPTNITRQTVDHYRVFERTWGFYSNRVIVPFFLKNELLGFCAIDILGKKEWVRRNPEKEDGEYRKVRYPLNLQTGKILFGFDGCQTGADDLILVEGVREQMKLWQEGFPNTVAILGAYLSDDHYKLLSELNPKRIALMFDGDDAGVAITERTAKKLSRNFNTLKCMLPRGKDPKNLSQQDFERLLKRN